MKRRAGRFVGSAATLLVFTTTCQTRSVSVERLLKQRQTYEGKVVVVSGCFRTGLESVTLQPCGGSNGTADALWVEDVRVLDDMERIIPGLRRDRRTNTELLTPKEAEAYQRLMSEEA